MTDTTDELEQRRTARAADNGGEPGDPPHRLPGEGESGHDDAGDVAEPQLALPGFRVGPLSMAVGKGRPSSAEFRMRSLALPLAGELPLDAKVWLLVEADVDDVGVKQHRKGRTVTARVRRHVATPQSVRVLTTDELEQLGVDGA